MNQRARMVAAIVVSVAVLSAACSSPESGRSFSIERLEAPPVGGGLGTGAVAPLTLSPGSGNAPGQVVRVRGLSAAARSGLIYDDGYSVCDKNNAGKCNTLNRKPTGVSFGIDSAIPYDSSTPLSNLYYADIPYTVDSDAPDRQVVPITFLDRNLADNGEDDIPYEQDFRVPVSNVTQVFNYLSNHATEADLAAQDQYFGATAFLPPDYTFAYTTLLSGALAVVNTDTDTGQQPAQVDLAFTRPAGGAVQVFQGTVAGGIGFVARTTKITIPQPKAIATGDFDEDGDLDLAVANSGGNTVAIFRADGIADTVSFPNGSTFTVGYGPSALAVGDIDKDGHVDIAVTLAGTSVPDCSAVVLWGAGAGSFTTGATISAGTAAAETPTGIAIGTLDGDAYPELVIAKHDRTSPNAGHVRTLLNQGSGAHTFSSATTYTVGNKPA